jgi:hypothetical protein
MTLIASQAPRDRAPPWRPTLVYRTRSDGHLVTSPRPGWRRHPWRRTLREGESQEHMNRLVKFIYPEVRPGCFPLRIDVDSGKKFYETQFNVTFRFWRSVHRSLGDFRCRNHCRVRWVPARLAPAGGSSSPGQHHPLSTRCTRWMAVSCARRAWQEGHTPRDLHEKGTSTSPRHAVQASRAKPWASTPQARYRAKSRSTKRGSPGVLDRVGNGRPEPGPGRPNHRNEDRSALLRAVRLNCGSGGYRFNPGWSP